MVSVAITIGVLLGAAQAGLAALPAAAADKPNVLFVLADDWGWGDIGSLAKLVNSGDKSPVTPQLDRLASEGTVFTRFHTLASVCSPSRASWLTGRYPIEVGSPYIYSCTHAANVKVGQADFVPQNSSFLPKTLKSAGYRTAHYGKWHLGCTPDAPSVNSYGYDDSATYVSNIDNSEQLGMNQTFNDPWFPANSSRMIVDRALAFMNATAKGTPFYINLWFHISHAPLNPTPEQLEPFNVTKYCPWSGSYSEINGKDAFQKCPIQIFRASQHDADMQIGRLMDQVRISYPNTMVFFSGDNGPEDPHIYFNSVGSAGAYRGRKRSLYEGGISTPLIAWWPDYIPAGVISHGDFASIDFFPTVLALTGLKEPPTTLPMLRGRDGSSLLSGKGTTAIRTNELAWEYILSMPGKCYHQSPRLAIYDAPSSMKLLMNPDRSRFEMYNISADWFEQNDLSEKLPSIAASLAQRLDMWHAAMPSVPPSAVVLNPGCTVTKKGIFNMDVDAEYRKETQGFSDYEIA